MPRTEREFGRINVIVKPKVYERCRAAVRMEPFLPVRGRLQKDGATSNVIAHQVRALEVGGRGRDGAAEDPSPCVRCLRRPEVGGEGTARSSSGRARGVR